MSCSSHHCVFGDEAVPDIEALLSHITDLVREKQLNCSNLTFVDYYSTKKGKIKKKKDAWVLKI
jgi:hypothetical protein